MATEHTMRQIHTDTGLEPEEIFDLLSCLPQEDMERIEKHAGVVYLRPHPWVIILIPGNAIWMLRGPGAVYCGADSDIVDPDTWITAQSIIIPEEG